MDKEKGHTGPQERSPAKAELPASERRRGRFAGQTEAERIWPFSKDNAVGMKESGCGRVTMDLGEQTVADWADESPLKAQLPPKSAKKCQKTPKSASARNTRGDTAA